MFVGKIIKYVNAYSLSEVVEKLNISTDDVLSFLNLRNYIILIDGCYYPTILGLESGCVVNSTSKDVIGITEEGVKRMKNAFTPEFTQAELDKISAIVSRLGKGVEID